MYVSNLFECSTLSAEWSSVYTNVYRRSIAFISPDRRTNAIMYGCLCSAHAPHAMPSDRTCMQQRLRLCVRAPVCVCDGCSLSLTYNNNAYGARPASWSCAGIRSANKETQRCGAFARHALLCQQRKKTRNQYRPNKKSMCVALAARCYDAAATSSERRRRADSVCRCFVWKLLV